MTAQISDVFRHRRRNYDVAGISEGDLFDPSLLDLTPMSGCTACWRGYQAVFAVRENRLILETLHVNLVRRIEGTREREEFVGPVINGIVPTTDTHVAFCNNHYKRLNYHLEYSGGLLLAKGFHQSLYVTWAFIQRGSTGP